MALLSEEDVQNLLPQEDLTTEQIDTAMRLVAGMLMTAAGLDTPPDALADSDPLFAPALELVLLLVDNPTSLTSRTAGPTSQYWPLAPRRDAILEQVRRRRTMPSGDFPCAQRWPDPAYGRTSWWNNDIDAIGWYFR